MSKASMVKRIPNLLTLINLMLGFAAVLFLLQPDHLQKPLIVTSFILLGGIADFFDGFLARKLHASTAMGKQLDSFADIITFGIAPVSLANYLAPVAHSVPLIGASLVFIVAGAYRLARYNLHGFSNHLMGLPITAAGIILAVYGTVAYRWAVVEQDSVYVIVTVVVLLVLSAVMVSKKKVIRRI